MEKALSKIKLTPREQDYAQWYLDVAKAGNLFEYSPTPGCMIFLPKSVTMWESIKSLMNQKLEKLGVQNLYLPLLIPYSFFEREKDHVEGFAPEVAVVTHAGGKELDEKLAIRPTSETMFCHFFKEQLGSYRDLPLLYNQWVNVMRWEKRTRPFLRTAEFYWQEGHTLHETKEEANTFALSILFDVYIQTIRELLAIDGIAGQKSSSEKFAGAETTYTFEPMMSNGWALQICTSHVLGQGFMEQFGVSFQGRDNTIQYPAYTSWGLSTRSIGGVISTHSDNKWLVIPPRLSEFKATILTIYGKENAPVVNDYALSLAKNIVGEGNLVPVQGENFKAYVGPKGKVLIDLRDARLGEKITDFELSGYPVRIECGERDMQAQTCMVASRIGEGAKESIGIAQVAARVETLLEEGQKALFAASQNRLKNNIVPCSTLEEIGAAVESGKFAIYAWDQNPQLEIDLKEKYKATTRCIPFKGQFTDDLLQVPEGKVAVIIARNF